ncbi:cytoplasmic tyrosine-protein kinase BMX-like [Acipenser ruthenus]|uniref:cytoplasmic tyrosine-protein kinase BMX-like n=1 Tax=Acipenser ruthenus TaxID=7906 RepID=UPI00145B73BC|nr:cytoplasmic tyrosine-protein kinase BMX-like [Acipenser ruthenus]
MDIAPIMEEVLLKMSQQKKKISPKNYKERLFELTKTTLSYYEHEKGKRGNKKGSILIEKIRCVETVHLEEQTPVERQYPFQIVYDEGILYIFANNESSRIKWLEALKHEIKNNSNLFKKYHSGFWADKKFLCCKQAVKNAPGCTLWDSSGKLKPDQCYTNKHLPPIPGQGREHTCLPPIPESGKTSLKIVVALYNYNRQDNTELSLVKGDKYYVLEEHSLDRWKVRDTKGTEGYVPTNQIRERWQSLVICNEGQAPSKLLKAQSLSESTATERFTLRRSHGINHEDSEDSSDNSLSVQSVNVEDYDWYTGNISRAKAEQLLKQKGKEGAFLVRDSSQQGIYTVSVFSLALQDKNGSIRHYRVNVTPDNQYYLAENHLFDSIPKMIQYHQHNAGGIVTRLRHTAAVNVNKVPSSAYGKWELNREEITLLKELGSGQFGVVQLGIWNGKYDVAIKMIKEGSMSEDEFIEEAQIMMKLRHPKLVSLYGVCTKAYPIYIVTEYMSNGCLLDYMKAHGKELQQTQLLEMCLDVCDAMTYLESQQFIHRDLAARNCLVEKDLTVKVSDFGMARYVMDDQYTSSAGTKFPVKWSAPEVLNYTRFSSKSDVWAFGVLMWEVFSLGKQPYDLYDNTQVAQKIMQGYRLYRPQMVNEDFYKVIKSCWHEKAEERPTFQQLLETIQSFLEE